MREWGFEEEDLSEEFGEETAEQVEKHHSSVSGCTDLSPEVGSIDDRVRIRCSNCRVIMLEAMEENL